MRHDQDYTFPKDPKQLKDMSLPELERLAAKIRVELLKTVSKNGGHLAPNLGVVELTIALHKVFDAPKDKMVWDVGHQSYVHKLLTGRWERFSSIRQHSGLSGFPKREESEFDAFDTGHSSTSISAALGMALARDLRNEKNKVLAIIGDGALTGGMAFEALNHAGHEKTDLIVILNDNEMSIAENVGAMSSYLTRMRTDPKYYKGKEDIEYILRRIPAIGPTVVKTMERIKDSFKYLVVPGMLFEELGFTYLGPIDGHNLNDLCCVLKDAKELHEPVLVHVITKKGKGYKPAEECSDKFHGTGPFDLETGKPLSVSKVPSYTEIFGKALVEIGKQDKSLLAITAAMPSGTGLNYFAKAYPKRFFDVGIAEQHAVTLAAGMATQGFRPVVAIYSTFLQRAYDQVLHDVCLQKLPIIFALDRAGIVGEDGPTHHGVFDISYLRPIPNLSILAPKDEDELRDMLKTAHSLQGPVAIRYPRGNALGVPVKDKPEIIPVGKGEVLQEGEHAAILAIGSMVPVAMQGAELLKEKGVNLTVANMRWVKPLDEGLVLELARKHKRLITMEEGVLAGGFGSSILELLEKEQIFDVEVVRIGIPDLFVDHGPVKVLQDQHDLSAQGIERVFMKKWGSVVETGNLLML